MPRHIVIKLTKIKEKEKLLKAAKEKWQIAYKGTPIRLTADFSAETLQARREWHDMFKVMKRKNLQPEYSTQQGFHPELMERSKVLQTSKTWNSPIPPTSFKRNVKGTPHEKEKATTRNTKGKIFIGKGKCTVKVVNHPCMNEGSQNVQTAGYKINKY